MPFGDGAEAFDVFYLGQCKKMISLLFHFVQGSMIGPSVELTPGYLCAETRGQGNATSVSVEGTLYEMH